MPTTTNPNLPRLKAQKAHVQQSAAAKRCNVLYTSDEVRGMPLDSPIRRAHWQGGDPAVRAYLASV